MSFQLHLPGFTPSNIQEGIHLSTTKDYSIFDLYLLPKYSSQVAVGLHKVFLLSVQIDVRSSATDW